MNNLFLASFASVMTTVGYVLVAILVLLVMITVHELGHYIAGKIFKFKIEEFAIGFGPKIFKKQKKNGEIFSIRLIPLGGFCSFGGEDKESDGPNDFNNKKPWQRIIVLVAGAFMNYLLSVIIICATFGAYGRNAILVNDIVEDPTYSTVSLVDDDVILSINGKKTYLLTDLMGTLEGKEKGELVTISVLRDKKVQSVQVALREDAIFKNLEDVEGLSNVLGTAKIEGKQNYSFYTTGVKLGFFRTIGESFSYSGKLATTVFSIIGQIFSGKIGLSSMGGTVTTISVTVQGLQTGGLWFLLNITSLIGVNLALFNLLPIPALDGSRVVFTIIEWIRKKPLNRKVEGVIHTVGFVLLLLFAILVDVQQCF